MAINFSDLGGGGASSIKSIQRGVTTSATTVTIATVDTSKCLVNSFSNATTGDVATTTGLSAGATTRASYATAVNFGTDWAARANGAYLLSSTELVTTGATRWEVVEFI